LDYQNNYVRHSSCWNVKTFCSIVHHAWVSYIIILIMVQQNYFQIYSHLNF